jgi:hypothetical protein
MGRQQCGGDEAALGGEVVAMGVRNLLDEAVGAQQSQQTGDARGLTALFLTGMPARVETLAQVSVAKAIEGQSALTGLPGGGSRGVEWRPAQSDDGGYEGG